MPFCPACRTEYREGIERCPECGTALVVELPPEPEAAWDPTEWVTIEELGDEVEARILEGFLLEHDLPVRVLSRHDHGFPATLGELSTVEVQVPAEDLERAIAVLEELDETEEAEPSMEPEGD